MDRSSSQQTKASQIKNKNINIIICCCRSEGEKVRVGDDLILVSVATERYLVSNLYTCINTLLA